MSMQMDEEEWKRFMKEIQVRDVDFICERGTFGNTHAGNRQLHQDKSLVAELYAAATTKEQKDIYKSWLAQTVFDRGGIFLKWDEEAMEFVEVSLDIVLQMCSQMLRDAAMRDFLELMDGDIDEFNL